MEYRRPAANVFSRSSVQLLEAQHMSNLVRFALIIGVGALFAGCGGSQPPIGAPLTSTIGPARDIVHRTTGASYRVIHRFVRPNHGLHPRASVIGADGWLYGTTSGGGNRGQFCPQSCGTVYRMDPASGTIKVLHIFGAGGSYPLAGVIDMNGTLYGTTLEGGSSNCSNGCGIVYSISKHGAEKTLYDFRGGTDDGEYPSAGLVNVDGTLYGTTAQGGVGNSGSPGCENGCGTIYSVTASGSEKVLYKFTGGPDGFYPTAGLVDVNGELYGTAFSGGNYRSGKCAVLSYNPGCGTVYRVSAAGNFKLLHRFAGGSDGGDPDAGLVDVNGTLYGTTVEGGGSGCGGNGCGTVYSISTSGAEKVLYSFSGGSDGSNPQAGLVNVDGVLYGTTAAGGGSGCDGNGCGTIYSVSTAGAETILHSFGGVPDGADPVAALVDVSGVLYGTTFEGGSGCGRYRGAGCGTVFALTP
jgi:uncharacterized repeat protein (TIGR03803 family)